MTDYMHRYIEDELLNTYLNWIYGLRYDIAIRSAFYKALGRDLFNEVNTVSLEIAAMKVPGYLTPQGLGI